jgi:hypothetical protein
MATNTTKAQPAITTTVNEMLLTLSFADGGVIKVDASLLSNEIQRDALMHGLKQKLVDAAAMSRNPDTGRSATLIDKFNAVKEVQERLLAGQWNKIREGGGATGGLLYRALCELYDRKTPEEIKAFLESKTDEEKAALRANPKVAAIISRLRTTKSDVDTDAMLGELGAGV